jgi:cation transporter-like permease
MDEGLIRLFIMIGVSFCLAGSLMAFLITYEGYMRGQNPDKRLAMRMAVQTALVALIALVVLVIGIAFVLADIILK